MKFYHRSTKKLTEEEIRLPTTKSNTSMAISKRTLFDLSKMCAFEPLVMVVEQENANGFRGISRFLSDSAGDALAITPL